MSRKLLLDITFMIANVVGIVIYLERVSLSWRIPEEHGMIPITGEPFVWFAALLPVVGVFLVVNIVWGVWIVRRGKPHGWLWWLVTGGLWVIAICIDFAHH
jgi:hypothetical protein